MKIKLEKKEVYMYLIILFITIMAFSLIYILKSQHSYLFESDIYECEKAGGECAKDCKDSGNNYARSFSYECEGDKVCCMTVVHNND